MLPVKKNLTILQGKTFTLPVKWETEPIVYKAISGITQAAPCIVDCTTHGVPDGWRVAIVSAKGMTQINAENDPPRDSDYVVATKIDVDTLELNSVNSSAYRAWTSGGYVQYNTPKDLSGYSARMSIKNKLSDTTADLWEDTTAYAEDEYVVIADGTVLQCTTAGTSGATEPTGAGTDGTVVWAEVSGFSGSIELLRLTDANGMIALDNTTKTISLVLSATTTAALTWSKAVYDLEMVSNAGVVTALLYGDVAVTKEVTT
jgi:hypothetical protein